MRVETIAFALTVIFSAVRSSFPPSMAMVPDTMILSASSVKLTTGSPPFIISDSSPFASLVKLSVIVSSPLFPSTVTLVLLANFTFSNCGLWISIVWQPVGQLVASVTTPPSAIVMVSPELVPEKLALVAVLNSFTGSIFVYSTCAPSNMIIPALGL